MNGYPATALAALLSFMNCRPTSAAEHGAELDKDSVTIEHVQVAFLPSSSVLDIYLVVWNGTAHNVEIVDVSSVAFGAVKVSSAAHLKEVPMSRFGRGVAVPARSELVMSEKWLHLVARPSGPAPEPNRTLPVQISFSDGRTQVVAATVLAPGVPPEDHHHGA